MCTSLAYTEPTRPAVHSACKGISKDAKDVCSSLPPLDKYMCVSCWFVRASDANSIIN